MKITGIRYNAVENKEGWDILVAEVWTPPVVKLTCGPKPPRLLDDTPGTTRWTLTRSMSKTLGLQGWGEKGWACALILRGEGKAIELQYDRACMRYIQFLHSHIIVNYYYY